jgi:hypothetical protein
MPRNGRNIDEWWIGRDIEGSGRAWWRYLKGLKTEVRLTGVTTEIRTEHYPITCLKHDVISVCHFLCNRKLSLRAYLCCSNGRSVQACRPLEPYSSEKIVARIRPTDPMICNGIATRLLHTTYSAECDRTRPSDGRIPFNWDQSYVFVRKPRTWEYATVGYAR